MKQLSGAQLRTALAAAAPVLSAGTGGAMIQTKCSAQLFVNKEVHGAHTISVMVR
jgi:hypothetical protein